MSAAKHTSLGINKVARCRRCSRQLVQPHSERFVMWSALLGCMLHLDRSPGQFRGNQILPFRCSAVAIEVRQTVQNTALSEIESGSLSILLGITAQMCLRFS